MQEIHTPDIIIYLNNHFINNNYSDLKKYLAIAIELIYKC